MPICQCQNGHFYDNTKHLVCPHCTGTQSPAPDDDVKTVAMSGIDKYVDMYMPENEFGRNQDTKTVAFYESQMKADPVVGWLVNIEGPEKGRDYRLHSGRNFIGRALRMDVLLSDDDGISRENHCSMVYDREDNTFSLVPGKGTNTYLNGTLLIDPVRVEDDDTIRLGNTELVFKAFCKGERKWL